MRKKLSKTVNEYLYDGLWKNKKSIFLLQIVYVCIPLILLSILYGVLYTSNALIIKGAYGFVNDLTNMFSLSYVFIFIYYMSGYYPKYSSGIVNIYTELLSNKNTKIFGMLEEKIEMKLIIAHILAVAISLVCSQFCIDTASLNGSQNWYSKLAPSWLVYYRVLIFLTWYMSTNTLFNTLTVSSKLYRILDFDLPMNVDNVDGSCGLKQYFRLISLNIGIACYFIIWIVLIVISDYRAIDYGVNNLFYKNPLFVIAIPIIATIYFTVVLRPFFKAKRKVYEVVDKELQQCHYPDKRINELKKIKYSMFSFKNIAVTLLTNLIPIIGAIIKIL